MASTDLWGPFISGLASFGIYCNRHRLFPSAVHKTDGHETSKLRLCLTLQEGSGRSMKSLVSQDFLYRLLEESCNWGSINDVPANSNLHPSTMVSRPVKTSIANSILAGRRNMPTSTGAELIWKRQSQMQLWSSLQFHGRTLGPG